MHSLQNNIHVSKVHCGSAFEPGASGLFFPFLRFPSFPWQRDILLCDAILSITSVTVSVYI